MPFTKIFPEERIFTWHCPVIFAKIPMSSGEHLDFNNVQLTFDKDILIEGVVLVGISRDPELNDHTDGRMRDKEAEEGDLFEKTQLRSWRADGRIKKSPLLFTVAAGGSPHSANALLVHGTLRAVEVQFR